MTRSAPGTRERNKELIRAFGSPLAATSDLALAIFFSLVCLIIIVYSSGQWLFLLTAPLLVVMMVDVNRSQKETSKLYSITYSDEEFNALSDDEVRWILVRARRRFFGMLALTLAAFIIALLPLVGVAADKYECDANPTCIWDSPLS